MVTSMSEQSGRDSASERSGPDQSGPERSGPERADAERSRAERSGADRSGADRSGADRSGADRSGADRSGAQRSGAQRQATPASDMLSDLQRWLLRTSARSMRKELSGQVRRTLGGGRQQTGPADIWDTATNEIPPEVGESPECQWCPICRAARRMRDAGPGLGGQLSGAGDAVASAVQDAVSALDSILSRAAGSGQRGSGGSGGSGAGAATKSESGRPAGGTDRSTSDPAGSGRETAAGGGGVSAPDANGSGDSDRPSDMEDAEHASLAGDHGPGGWKPGDRLATEHPIDPDPWSQATEADDGISEDKQPAADADASPLGQQEAQLDRQGHGPDDRG
jgi:hypothetical protein